MVKNVFGLALVSVFFNCLTSPNLRDTSINTNTTYVNLINANLFKKTDLQINNSAFEIQVLSTLAIKCQDDFKIFLFASAMRRQKKTIEDIFVYSVGNSFGMPRHFVKGYDLVFK